MEDYSLAQSATSGMDVLLSRYDTDFYGPTVTPQRGMGYPARCAKIPGFSSLSYTGVLSVTRTTMHSAPAAWVHMTKVFLSSSLVCAEWAQLCRATHFSPRVSLPGYD